MDLNELEKNAPLTLKMGEMFPALLLKKRDAFYFYSCTLDNFPAKVSVPIAKLTGYPDASSGNDYRIIPPGLSA